MSNESAVLIVEDERRQCAEIVRHVEAMGAQSISVATTAQEALRITVQQRPGIVILDGLLPGMHGFEVARLIRGIDASYQPRIIVTTAIYKNVRYQNDAKLKYGVDAYLIKPITAKALREAMMPAAA